MHSLATIIVTAAAAAAAAVALVKHGTARGACSLQAPGHQHGLYGGGRGWRRCVHPAQ